MSLIDHIEGYVGEIERGWKDRDTNNGLQILSVNNSPCLGCRTFVSLGLSNNLFQMSSSRNMRMEVVLTVESERPSELIASFLFSICEALLTRPNAKLRGDIIPLGKTLTEKLGIHSLYCTIPQYFDDSFETFIGDEREVVMIWLVPLFESEANFIEQEGWNRFEDLLEELDPELWLLDRAPLI